MHARVRVMLFGQEVRASFSTWGGVLSAHARTYARTDMGHAAFWDVVTLEWSAFLNRISQLPLIRRDGEIRDVCLVAKIPCCSMPIPCTPPAAFRSLSVFTCPCFFFFFRQILPSCLFLFFFFSDKLIIIFFLLFFPIPFFRFRQSILFLKLLNFFFPHSTIRSCS